MSKRSRAQHKDLESEQPQPQTVDNDSWNTPDFHRSVLIDLAFVALPAIVMAALGEHTIAAAWFGVGVLVILYQFRREIRDLWRSLRPTGQNDGEE
jgi:hypothetical protein